MEDSSPKKLIKTMRKEIEETISMAFDELNTQLFIEFWLLGMEYVPNRFKKDPHGYNKWGFVRLEAAQRRETDPKRKEKLDCFAFLIDR